MIGVSKISEWNLAPLRKWLSRFPLEMVSLRTKVIKSIRVYSDNGGLLVLPERPLEVLGEGFLLN